VLLNCAKEAPAAFLPHLQPLVARVQQLWDQVGPHGSTLRFDLHSEHLGFGFLV
jgi:hypothetical protein